MSSLSISLFVMALVLFPAGEGISSESSGNKMSLFSEFKNAFNSAYNEEVNGAHFKGALVDAALLRRTITFYYLQNSTFPASLEDTNHSGFNGNEAVSAELGENGAFQVHLSELFGPDKYITMQPIMKNNEITEWTCHSNVSAALMKDTFCSPVEE